MDLKEYMQCKIFIESNDLKEYFSTMELPMDMVDILRECFNVLDFEEGSDYKLNGFKSWIKSDIIDENVLVIFEAAEIEFDEEGQYLEEGIQQAYKKFKSTIKRYYRCQGGSKDGQLVADPVSCAKRKNPKRVLHGQIVSRTRKNIRVAKTAIAKHQTLSKLISKLNKRWNTP